MVMDRKPYVAGRFYPDDPQKLGSMLESFFEGADTKTAVPSIIVPHAGYMYSGKVAGAIYSKIWKTKKPEIKRQTADTSA